jgi:hypothetical protein
LRPNTPLFRIAEADPWSKHPDPKYANRFDDPDRRLQTLYASSQRLACFLECLDQFVPAITAELAGIGGEADFEPGLVPRVWWTRQLIGAAAVDGEFAPIYSAEWISHLRLPLRNLLRAHGIEKLDAAVLKSDDFANRGITRAAAKVARLSGKNGIYYASRHGDDLENWAIFEPWTIRPLSKPQPIAADDPALIKALSLFGLELEI